MRLKITVRFMLAVLIVSIAANFINIVASLYYSYKANAVSYTVSMMIRTEKVTVAENKYPLILNDTLRVEVPVKTVKSKIYLDEDFVENVKSKNGWIEVVDSSGREIESINKPAGVTVYYTRDESGSITGGTLSNDKYGIMMSSAANGEIGDDVICVIGLPKNNLDLKMLYDYMLDYFTDWNKQKLVTMAVTFLIALVLGYFFAVRMSRPVVKITDGIASMAGGNYSITFPEDGIYKDVYKGLNHMAAALKSSELERQKVERMREEWITNITHDLKTPLSSIKGYGELLMESGGALTGEVLDKYSRVILDKSGYMEVLIDDLKLSQRLKNDLIPLKKKDGDLVELLREVVIDILNDPRHENRTIVFDAEGELCLKFDPFLMRRAFTNIIYNSIVHNPKDTVIRIRTCKSSGICIAIEDNGRGISEEDREKLFERYYRGTSTGESCAGSGLGLAIAKQVVEAHGGRIELESEIGKGTTVRVIF